MLTSAVFTFVCDDRPGLVESLANTVRDQGGNWLESRLSHLAGKFAGIVRINIEETQLAALEAAFEELGANGISVNLERDLRAGKNEGATARLTVMGHDRPGIVHEIAKALAARNFNILQLDSGVNSAPMAGTPLFEALIHLQAPSNQGHEDIEDDLHEVADSLDLDLSLEWD